MWMRADWKHAQPPIRNAIENCRPGFLHRHPALAAVAAGIDRPAGLAAFACDTQACQAVADGQAKTPLAGEALQQAAIRRAPGPLPEFGSQKPGLEGCCQMIRLRRKLQAIPRHARRIGGDQVGRVKIGRRKIGLVEHMRAVLACMRRP